MFVIISLDVGVKIRNYSFDFKIKPHCLWVTGYILCWLRCISRNCNICNSSQKQQANWQLKQRQRTHSLTHPVYIIYFRVFSQNCVLLLHAFKILHTNFGTPLQHLLPPWGWNFQKLFLSMRLHPTKSVCAKFQLLWPSSFGSFGWVSEWISLSFIDRC